MTNALSRSALFGGMLLSAVALGACGDDDGDNADDSGGNGGFCDGVVAEAGDNQSIQLGKTVRLDASGSTLCPGGSPEFEWAFDSVPEGSTVNTASLSENNSLEAGYTSFTPDVEGAYVLSLIVRDGNDVSQQDLIVVDVVRGDLPPTANCGRNRRGEIGERVEFDGTGSYDPEGTTLEYDWSLSAPSCSSLKQEDLFDADTARPNLVPDCDGSYVLSLVVGDGTQWSEPDNCTLTVGTDNVIPVADAGTSSKLSPCGGNQLVLNGYGSYDVDGDALTYKWTLISVPEGSLASDLDFVDSGAALTKFTWDVEGEYVFELQVYDGQAWSAPDLVVYNVAVSGENRAPTAQAGDASYSATRTADCVRGDGFNVYICEMCNEIDITLNGSLSTDPDGDTLSYLWTLTSKTSTAPDPIITAPNSAHSFATIPERQATYPSQQATHTYTFRLLVADCEASSTDSYTVYVPCTGTI